MITKLYRVTCNVCQKRFRTEPLEDREMQVIEHEGWLVLYSENGLNPYAAICPACWDQIVDCWNTLGAGKATK